jgi:hypothetical protein
MEVFSISGKLYYMEMNAWCDVFNRFDAVGTLVSVGVVCAGIFCAHENT